MPRSSANNRVSDLGITKALYLHGRASSYVTMGRQTFLDGTPFTFCTRHWPTNPAMSYDGSIFGYGFDAATNKGYAIRADAATRRLQFFYLGGVSVTAPNFRLIGKKYIFVDFNGVNTVRIFDGTTLKDTVTGAAPNTSHTNIDTFVGTRDSTARYSAGVFGDTAIYNRLLTDAERLAIVKYAQYSPIGLQVMYRMDDESATIKDYSGNNRNGTMPSGVWRDSPFNA